jgi:hypothetical protein
LIGLALLPIVNTLRAGYSPDGLDGNILLECKAFNVEKHLKIIKAAKRAGMLGIPIEISAQIFFGLTITELPKARLLLYNPDVEDLAQKLWIIDISTDRKIISNFKRKLLPQPVGAI